MRPFVHHIDPVIAEFSGIYLWWYGLSYTPGFLGLFLWLWRARNRLRMSLADLAGMSQSTYYQVRKRGLQSPPTIKKICDALGLSMEDVYIDDQEVG